MEAGLLEDHPESFESLKSDCEIVAETRSAHRFDRPVTMRYLFWLGDILRGDFG